MEETRIFVTYSSYNRKKIQTYIAALFIAKITTESK